jgi:hypothetical protein
MAVKVVDASATWIVEVDIHRVVDMAERFG